MTTSPTDKPYSIVVGIDFCPACEAGIRTALRIAGDHPGSEVHAVHVLDPKSGRSKAVRIREQAVALEELPDRMRAYLAEHAGTLPRGGETSLGVHVRFGEPAQGILQMATDAQADLIVVGTHGREGLKRLTLGSVAEQIVRTAPCPVLVARPVDYTGLTASDQVEPPCPHCLEARERSGGAQWFCDTHERARAETHTYSAVRPVRWSHGSADFHGAGTRGSRL